MALAVRLASFILPCILLLTMPARADDVQIGASLVCDTRQQAERFVTVYDGDAEAAVSTVNAEEHDPNACIIGVLAYIQGPPLATNVSGDKMFHIVPIVVVGIVTPTGIQAVDPVQYFSAQEVEGFGI